jgi:hypothetical protein
MARAVELEYRVHPEPAGYGRGERRSPWASARANDSASSGGTPTGRRLHCREGTKCLSSGTEDKARVESWDNDGNGWDDLWEALFGSKGTFIEPNFDNDGDGWTNYWEMVRFQDPQSPDLVTSKPRRMLGETAPPPTVLPAFGSKDESKRPVTPPFMNSDGVGVIVQLWLDQRTQREDLLRDELGRTDALRHARWARRANLWKPFPIRRKEQGR